MREAEQLARDEDFNPLSLLTEHFSQLRRYGPTLLEAFEFNPAPVAREPIEAVRRGRNPPLATRLLVCQVSSPVKSHKRLMLT